MKLVTFQNLAEMAGSAVSLLEEHFLLRCDRPHVVLLTGGQTPMGIYRTIQRQPPPLDDSLHLMITDERQVPIESPESNCGRISPPATATRRLPGRQTRQTGVWDVRGRGYVHLTMSIANDTNR